MVWNSLSPDGTKSVKQNTVPMQQNTVYTETTLDKDHFWNIGVNEDGYHRKVSMENFADTAIGAPTDPIIPTGMDGVFYIKEVNSRMAGFYRNSNGIYQAVPAFITGVVTLGVSFTTVVAVPDDSYGELFFYSNDATVGTARGYYKAVGGVCQAYVIPQQFASFTSLQFPLLFGNSTNASALDLRARTFALAPGDFQYRITFRAT